MPEHVGELVDHAPVVHRDELPRLDIQVRLAGEGRPRRRVHAPGDLERAEAMAEGDLRLVVQRPAAEDENGVLLEGGADLRPRGIVQEARDVRPVDLGGEVRRETGRDDGHGGATPSRSADSRPRARPGSRRR